METAAAQTITRPGVILPASPVAPLQALRHHGDQALGGIVALRDALTARLMTQLEEAQQQSAGTYTIPQWLAGEEKAGDIERSPS